MSKANSNQPGRYYTIFADYKQAAATFLTFSTRFPSAHLVSWMHQPGGTHDMSREQRLYISYLLRLWQTQCEGELIWRASLESPHTGERRGFSNLEELVRFLEELLSHVEQLDFEITVYDWHHQAS
jgi:hypothetical protein